MAKPSDFFLGIFDFFAVLLPGACFVYLLQFFSDYSTLTFLLPESLTQNWVLFLVLAYIAGHFLHEFGGLLLDNSIYNNIYIRFFRKNHYHTSKLIRDHAYSEDDSNTIQTLLGRVYLTNSIDTNGTNYYNWCYSTLRISSSNGAKEVDRLQANSKFFRSLVFVFILAAALGIVKSLWLFFLVSIALTLFAIWRYCNLRWTATKRIYEYYLIYQLQKNNKG